MINAVFVFLFFHSCLREVGVLMSALVSCSLHSRPHCATIMIIQKKKKREKERWKKTTVVTVYPKQHSCTCWEDSSREVTINCQLLSYRFIITNKENKSVFTQLKDRKMYLLCQKLRVHPDTRPPVIFLGYHQSTRAEGQGWGHPLITVML